MKYYIFLLFFVIIAGCVSTEAAVVDLDASEFARIIENKDVFVIDTHIPEQDHIKGTNAVIAYNELESSDALPSDKNTPIGVYCRSGSMSAEAAQTLLGMGYKNIYNLEGGTNEWREAGLEFDNELPMVSFDKKITVYKSPTCGCCIGYIAELERQGFDVELISTRDTSSIKQRYNIPTNMQSCHTSIIGDYFVEGHVPIDTVRQLMEERPDIDGIVLPDMPAGSPGMPGVKRGLFHIYALSDGVPSDYTKI